MLLTALTLRHLVSDEQVAGVKALMLIVLASAIRASSEGVPRLLVTLGDASAIPLVVSLPTVRLAATAGAS